MPRLLALEWDAREARLAVGRTAGKGVVVEAAFAVELGGSSDDSDDSIGKRLAGALAENGVGNCDALVAVPRGKTELRVLQTPPVPDDELPELVRFQALQQFSSLGEDWPLDFVRLDSDDEQQIRILAAALSPDMVRQIRDSCTACQTPAKNLVLRPFATASLFKRSGDDGRCRLLVELLSEEVDLTVLVDSQVVFLRSVRLSAENMASALVGEIRRTIAAAQNQLGEHRIQAVTLVGNKDEDAELSARLADGLDLEVQLFDPFAKTELGSPLRDAPPTHPGRFAALLGMLHDEAEGLRHGIDFLNPRRKPEPPDPRRRYALVGTAVAAVALSLIAMLWWYFSSYNKDIAKLRAECKELEPAVEEANKLHGEIEEIEKFVASDINWLDELCELSEDLPPAEEMIVDRWTFTARARGGGQIILEGGVRDHSVIQSIETKLRDPRHDVHGGTQFDRRQQDYPTGFKTAIDVSPPGNEEPEKDE